MISIYYTKNPHEKLQDQKREIKDVFIELGLKGISPITLYNDLKDFIDFRKEDFEGINKVYHLRYDDNSAYVFFKFANEVLEYVSGFSPDMMSISYFKEIPAWEKLVESLDSRED